MTLRIASAVVILSTFAGCESNDSVDSPATPSAAVVAKSTTLLVKTSADPRDAWKAAVPRLSQANDQSKHAMEARLAAIDGYLTECKRGTRPFAVAVLGTEGKFRYSGGLLEQAAGALAEVFGSTPSTQDSFRDYVAGCYRRHVLDQTKLQPVIDAAITGYAGDLQAIESRLLVDLQADLGDKALDWKGALPQMPTAVQIDLASDDAIDKAVAVAGDDMATLIVSEIASAVIGNAISEQITNETDSFGKKAAVNFVVGRQVDQVLDGAMAMAGHDPISGAAARASASLDHAGKRIIGGDPVLAEAFTNLLMQAYRYPDETVRNACRDAVKAVERSPVLGLRSRLARIHLERSAARALAIHIHMFGTNADLRNATLYTLDPKAYFPPAELIRWAAQWKAHMGDPK